MYSLILQINFFLSPSPSTHGHSLHSSHQIGLYTKLLLLYILLFNWYLNKFNHCHLGIISLPGHSPQHTSVTSLPIRIPLRGGLEQRVDQILIINPSKGLTSSMKISSLSQLNHVINVFTNCLGTYKGSLDTSVTDDFSGECTQKSLTLVGGLAELGNLLSVTHHVEFGCAGGGAGGGNWCLGDCGDVGSGEGGGAWSCEFDGRKIIWDVSVKW